MTTRKFPPRVRVFSATTGTGTLTLGAAWPGSQAVPANCDGCEIDYTIADGADWEEGRGVYSAGANTLTRGLIASSTGALLDLSGNESVFSTISSRTMEELWRTEWVEFTYDGAHFSGGPNGLYWQVDAADQKQYRYRYISDSTLAIAITLTGTTFAGLADFQLQITLPAGRTVAKTSLIGSIVATSSVSGVIPVLALAAGNNSLIVIDKQSGDPWSSADGSVAIYIQAIFEVNP
ncbi:MAG: hypothetical protein HY749_16255 [Gammaproteobacteria bacterium]|nr:hypothetical protein [Gammaproteobacteria bacterium]